MEVREQLIEVGSFLPSWGFQDGTQVSRLGKPSLLRRLAGLMVFNSSEILRAKCRVAI